MLSYLFVLVPLALYLPAFLYETYIAFKRLKKNNSTYPEYLHSSWEVTHTLLIVSVNYFIWLFAEILTKVGQAVYWGLIIASALFIVRGILYLKLFVANPGGRVGVYDQLFAWVHIGILLSLVYVLVRTVVILATNSFRINSQFIPWMWPGLALVGAICFVPFVTTYSRRK